MHVPTSTFCFVCHRCTFRSSHAITRFPNRTWLISIDHLIAAPLTGSTVMDWDVNTITHGLSEAVARNICFANAGGYTNGMETCIDTLYCSFIQKGAPPR